MSSSLGKALVILNYGGARIGLVLELTGVEINFGLHERDLSRVSVQGLLLDRVDPDSRPDIGPPAHLPRTLPEKT